MSKRMFSKMCLLFVMLLLSVALLPIDGVALSPPTSDKVIIILATKTIEQMQQAREIVEENGGRISNIFPTRVFFGTLPRDSVVKLRKQTNLFQEISYGQIELKSAYKSDWSVLDAIKIWNNGKAKTATKKVGKMSLMPAAPGRSQQAYRINAPFKDELIFPKDLPKSKEERIRINQQYQQRRKKKVSLSDISTGKQSAFGKAYGAGYFDTSLYMAGDIAVGVFFMPGSETVDTIFQGIVDALEKFIDDQPNANITFTFIKELDDKGNPKLAPDNVRDYANDLRNAYNTHWAYMITVHPGFGKANAMLGGPSLNLYSSDLRDGYAVRHETMHIFGALDQYAEAHSWPIQRSGYLNVVNANSQYKSGNGYFNGQGEGQADIMIAGGPIGVYTRGQIGWRDSDGDGILDPLDTYPDTRILNKSGSVALTYRGKAADLALLNSGSIYGDVTLNSIAKVEYRLNGGVWCPVQASDGKFDNSEEDFSFTLPALKNGKYTVEVRATNSVGNTEISYAKDEFTVTGSRINGVNPFADITIKPPKGSIDTNFIFTALVSDIEDDAAGFPLQVKWDFENDGIWDTGYSTTKATSFRYSTPGVKTIKLQVMDRDGLITTAASQVTVAGYNLLPHAFFTVTPENTHGINSSEFKVTLDANSSYDDEDDLKLRWGAEAWGTDMVTEYRCRLPAYFSSLYVNFGGNAADVFVSGNYAYVAAGYEGLQIIDISNPKAPVLAGSCDIPGSASDVFVSGSYAYLAAGYEGLQIIDISNPKAPVLAGSYNTLRYASNVFVSGSYAYVAAGHEGLQIIDISNPKAPILVGSYASPGSAIVDVFISGSYAYVTDTEAGLQIIDVNNHKAPVLAGSYDTPGSAAGVFVSGSYAYITDTEVGLQITGGLQIIDVSNPKAPVLAGSYDTLGYAFNVFVSGNYAYVADYDKGLKIIDISNPKTPVLVGSCDTLGHAHDVFVSGSYAYVADWGAGLQIIDVSPKTGNEAVIPQSKHWRINLELRDKKGNTSQASRDIWAVTYNRTPLLENVEFTNREAPSFNLAGSGERLSYDIEDVFVSGNYAYVADWSAGLQIINVSNPKAPVLVGNYDTPGSASGVFVSGSYAYVADRDKGLQIIDVSNPQAPVLAGSYDTPGSASGVFVSGSYAFVADWSAGLEIINISNPKVPVLLGSCYTSGGAYSVFVSWTYAYVADRYTGLKIIDFINIRAPVLVGSYNLSGDAYDVFVSGNYAYVAERNKGLQIIDVTNSKTPTLAYSLSFSDKVNSVFVLGNYVYVGSDRLSIIQRLPPSAVGIRIRAIGGNDLDINTTWDGLLEYRWDFDNDGTWDSKFSESKEVNFTLQEFINLVGPTIACQVSDRFGATKTVISKTPDTTAPTITHSIPKPPYRGNVQFKATVTDSGSGVDSSSVYIYYQDMRPSRTIRWRPLQMKPSAAGNNVYVASMAISSAYNTRYYIKASDNVKNEVSTPIYDINNKYSRF